MKNKAKPWYRSKVIWFNGLAIVVMALAGTIHQLESLMTPEVYAALSWSLAFANTALRLITTRPIALDDPDKTGGRHG